MPDDFSLDPELKAIFAEIASGPNTLLAYLPRTRTIRCIEENSAGISPRSAGLSAAERQLLRVHGEEAAAFLRQVFGSRLVTSSRSRGQFFRHISARTTIPILAERSVTSESRSRLERISSLEDDTTSRALRSLTIGNAVTTLLQLALAAYRIEPTDSSRIHVALDSLRLGYTQQVVRTLQLVLEGGCSKLVEPYAWEALGIASAYRGERDRALACYERASRLDGERFTAAISIFFMAVQLGIEDRALRASVQLDALVEIGCPTIVGFVEVLSERKRKGDWTPSASSASVLHKIIDQLGPSSRKIAHVF